jgi:hypothetical protein
MPAHSSFWLRATSYRVVRGKERQRAFETQDDEIKFLKESYARLRRSTA